MKKYINYITALDYDWVSQQTYVPSDNFEDFYRSRIPKL